MGYSKEKLQKYFERINYTGTPDRTSETLSEIQRLHMNAIPYENLDILAGVPLSLDEDDLFEKMVVRKRGGYCFEQNGLLLAALEGLGFEVKQFCGRFIIGETGISDRRHRVLKVQAEDGVFISDVGVYGESPRCALRFAEGEVQSDGLCEYRYVRDGFYGWIEQQLEAEKDWKNIYGFTEEVWLTRDFIQPSFFCEKHPESAFTSFRKVGIFRGDESLTYIDNVFTIYAHGKIIRREEFPESKSADILKQYFNLEV